MDELDKSDFEELCKGATDKQLVNLCEYELKNAKSSILEEDSEMHYEFANIAYIEMERRNII
jgi:hypothetical protein